MVDFLLCEVKVISEPPQPLQSVAAALWLPKGDVEDEECCGQALC